jgi:AraC-like DNA-binding protein
MPLRHVSERGDDPFWGKILGADFGETQVFEIGGSAMDCIIGGPSASGRQPGLMLDLLLSGGYARHGDVVAWDGAAVLWHTHREVEAGSPMASLSRAVVIPETALSDVVQDPAALSGLAVRNDVVELALIRSYMNALDLAAGVPRPDIGMMVGLQLRDLVVSMVARMLRKDDPSEGRGVKAARLKSIRALVERQYASPTLSVSRVARQLGVSERYVQKLLDETGTSFGKLLMETRLDAAHRALETATTAQSIGTVAEACGFSDASHFTRAFRQRFGTTPSSVRGSGAAEHDAG